MKNSIWKSFEDFVMTPVSILKGSIIHIVNLKTNLTDRKSVNVDIMNRNIQINVINSDKMYNLLSTVMYKRRMRELRENVENKKYKVLN